MVNTVELQWFQQAGTMKFISRQRQFQLVSFNIILKSSDPNTLYMRVFVLLFVTIGTQERVLVRQGIRAIRVRAI